MMWWPTKQNFDFYVLILVQLIYKLKPLNCPFTGFVTVSIKQGIIYTFCEKVWDLEWCHAVETHVITGHDLMSNLISHYQGSAGKIVSSMRW